MIAESRLTDDLVQVLGDNLGNSVQTLEVVGTVGNESRKRQRGQVADGDFIGSRVLDDFGAQVGRLDCSQVLLV
jgi:hypothetical protein